MTGTNPNPAPKKQISLETDVKLTSPVVSSGNLTEVGVDSSFASEVQRTMEEYDQVSHSYTAAVSLPDIISKERERIRFGVGLTANRGEAPQSVLDVGCAGARDLEAWKDLGITYHGIDHSEGMLGEAREHASNNGITDATFDRANILDMKIRPSSVSLVWCSSVIQHVPKDKVEGVLREFERALENGGILYLNVRPPKEGVAVEGMVTSHEYERRDGEKHVERFIAHYSLEEMTKLLENIGFHIESDETYAEVYDQYDDGGEKAAYIPEKFVIFARKLMR